MTVFAPIAHWYGREIMKWVQYHGQQAVTKPVFLTRYVEARKEGFKPRTIRNGWRLSGLYPFNPQVVLDSIKLSATPPQSPVYRVPNEDALLITPKNIRMIHQTKEELNKVQSIGQEFRTGFAKLVKKTEDVMTENAILEQDLAGYDEAKKDAQNVVKRRRTQTDPNNLIINKEAVVRARRREEQPEKTQSQAEALSLELEDRTNGGKSLKDYCVNFFA